MICSNVWSWSTNSSHLLSIMLFNLKFGPCMLILDGFFIHVLLVSGLLEDRFRARKWSVVNMHTPHKIQIWFDQYFTWTQSDKWLIWNILSSSVEFSALLQWHIFVMNNLFIFLLLSFTCCSSARCALWGRGSILVLYLCLEMARLRFYCLFGL